MRRTLVIAAAILLGAAAPQAFSRSLAAVGLPTGWTQDHAHPANVQSNGGNLDLGAGQIGTRLVSATSPSGNQQFQVNADGGQLIIAPGSAELGTYGGGYVQTDTYGVRLSGSGSQQVILGQWGTLATDEATGYIIVSVPISDPHVSGALWSAAGTLKVSAG